MAYAHPVETQQTFRMLLMAMARPGTVQALHVTPGEPPLLGLLSALADHEVGFTLVSDVAEHRPLLPDLGSTHLRSDRFGAMRDRSSRLRSVIRPHAGICLAAAATRRTGLSRP